MWNNIVEHEEQIKSNADTNDSITITTKIKYIKNNNHRNYENRTLEIFKT